MDTISKRVRELAPSGIRKFFDLVMGMKGIISLGVGEPDFVTPWSIREAAIHSIEQGYTSYTSNKGLKELRIAISNHMEERYRLNYDPDSEVLITVGVSEAMDLVVRSLVNPGDKVLIPELSYVSYSAVVSLAGGIPVNIPTNSENNFKILPKDIKKAYDNKTKCIILNYPSNPTGTSYTKTELEALRKVINECKLTVISDEIYADLTYDFTHVPWPTLRGTKSKCIYLNGFSKSYAMTGWRIAYALGPKEIISAMTKIHQYTMLCAPTPSQMAAIEAIQNGESSICEMKEEYKRRRSFIVNSLNKIGLSCNIPDGAFYVFPDIKNTGLNSIDFANALLKTEHVAVVPGTAFGPSGKDYIRISYASSMENLREAISRIGNFIKTLKGV